MSTPGGFEYTDDSVIAKVSFDIPASTVTDISQITQVMGAMRTELESIARAQSDWLDYLQQVPQIAERANQVFREQITLMERMSYIQNEIGGIGGGVAGGGGAAGVPGGGGGGGFSTGMGAYSTAAAPGYANPFQGMTSGTGSGFNPNVVASKMAEIAEDPRAAAEMAAARGIAINPALIATVAGGAAAFFGQGTGSSAGDAGGGKTTSGSTSPQDSQSQRRSANPPVASEGGVPSGSEPQNVPNSGTPASGGVQKILSEVAANAAMMGRGTRFGKIMGGVSGIGSEVLGMLGGGGDGGSGGGGAAAAGAGGGHFGRGLGALGSSAKAIWSSMNKPTRIAAAAGLGTMGFNRVQRIGERMTELQMLGSEEGGDYATGLKEDLHARMIALDPFINTEQARKAIALPMQAGFQGESRDQLRDLLINNFKELGISMADSMRLEMANLRGVELTDENVLKSRSSSEAFLNAMKEMAGDGGNTMSLSQRKELNMIVQETLSSMGVSQESQQRASIGLQQGYDDSVALRGKPIARMMGQTMGSGTLTAMVGQKLGITGILPEAMPDVLAEMGYDADQVMEMAAAEAAKYVSGMTPEANRIAAFMSLMNDQGVEMDYSQAKDLYRKVTGKKEDRPTAKANKRVSELGKKNKQPFNPLGAIKDFIFGKTPEDFGDALTGRNAPSDNALRTNEMFQQNGRVPSDQFAPAGRRSPSLPQSAAQMPPSQTIKTQGQVTGNVTITIDQQGRATGPPTIQLSGQQKAVNSGAGSAQLNNPQPGDPSYHHAHNTLPGGA